MPPKKDSHNFKKAGLAVAASMLLAVVLLSGNQLHKSFNLHDGINTIAQRSVESEQMNARFQEYLQAHDNVWYVSNNVGVQSYARVASFRQK